MSHARIDGADRHLAFAESRHRHAQLAVCIGCGLILVAQVALAGDAGNRKRGGEPPVAGPTVTGNLSAPGSRQLSLGFSYAKRRIQARPSCAALFSRLGADGLETLARVRYEAVDFDRGSDACGKVGVPAYTKVGSHQVTLCPDFAVLSVAGAAQTVIHEALHSAGLSEKPADPHGLGPQEINQMVQVSCGF